MSSENGFDEIKAVSKRVQTRTFSQYVERERGRRSQRQGFSIDEIESLKGIMILGIIISGCLFKDLYTLHLPLTLNFKR